LVAAATDVFTVTGAAQRRVSVLRIRLNGTATAPVPFAPILVLRRNAANTGGGAAVMASVMMDPGAPRTGQTTVNAPPAVAPFALVQAYSANPSLGGGAAPDGGVILLTSMALGTAPAIAGDTLIDFAANGMTPPVLRSANEVLAVNFNSVTYAGGLVSCTFEFTDEPS
jgi:hypothetical protein